MRNLTILILTLITLNTHSNDGRIRIAVIDSGIYKKMTKEDFVCRDGVKSTTGKNPYDSHGHGSNIVGIIGESINPKTHCIVSYKFYSTSNRPSDNFNASLKALRLVANDKSIKFVNLSLGGRYPDHRERRYIKKLLDRGVVIVAAAGNDRLNLDLKKNNFYPASYRDEFKHSNFYVVSSRSRSTNYGKIVTDTFSGVNVGPKNIPYVRKMTGSSQAAAQKTADLFTNR